MGVLTFSCCILIYFLPFPPQANCAAAGEQSSGAAFPTRVLQNFTLTQNL